MFRFEQSLKLLVTFLGILAGVETYGKKKPNILFFFYKESEQVFTFLLAAEQTGCWREAEDQKPAGQDALPQSVRPPAWKLFIHPVYKELFLPRATRRSDPWLQLHGQEFQIRFTRTFVEGSNAAVNNVAHFQFSQYFLSRSRVKIHFQESPVFIAL